MNKKLFFSLNCKIIKNLFIKNAFSSFVLVKFLFFKGRERYRLSMEKSFLELRSF